MQQAETVAARLAVPRELGGVELAGCHPAGNVVTATIDGAARPDVADLRRILRLERRPHGRADWRARIGARGRGFAVLTIRIRGPVRCTFRLRYDLVRERPVLDALAECGRVLVTPLSPLPDPA